MSNTNWETIFSMSEMHELQKLSEWAHEFRGSIAIELGSFQGKTAALLAEHFNTVFAIDLYGNIEKGMESYDEIGKVSLDIIVENLKQRKLIGRVIPVIAPSEVLMQFYGINPTPNLIFVDAGHDYNNAYWDLYNAHIIVNSQGIVIAHDYKRDGWGFPPYDHGKYDPWWEVAKVIDQLIYEGKYKIHEKYFGIVALKPIK